MRRAGVVAEHRLQPAGGKGGYVFEVADPGQMVGPRPRTSIRSRDRRVGRQGRDRDRDAARGFRSVEIRDAQLLVNGQPVLIKGADRHEMDPVGGYVVSRRNG